MDRTGILFVISGPSGVGKGTVREAVLKRLTDIKMSVSATTRPPRAGETDGLDYFFIDPEKFEQMYEQGEFLECARVYDNRYGTPRHFVNDNLARGVDVLLEIDIQGAMQVKEKMPQGVFIFIQPPSIEALVQRIYKRGKDPEDSIKKRMAACREEMDHSCYYDYLVVNDDLQEAVNKVHAIIVAERCRIRKEIEE
ncbi:MAG TPA: guanylate kinase [Syntrophomonas sp.]|nr:guanylate kinase [Syntrophomonas sp.]